MSATLEEAAASTASASSQSLHLFSMRRRFALPGEAAAAAAAATTAGASSAGVTNGAVPRAEEREAAAGPSTLSLAPTARAEEVQEVEECIEEMLIRLDEFCTIIDMIRNSTSQLLDDVIPLMKDKVIEMNNIYTRVDKLEAFVKMAGHHVSFLESQVAQAEKAHAIFPYTVWRLFGSLAAPSFEKKCTTAPQNTYSLPELYRTEDYFPIKYISRKYQSH